MSNSGVEKERDLVNWFFNQGARAHRLAASGGGSTRDLPDVFAVANGRRFAIELKYTTRDKTRIDSDEIEALTRFAADWSADPLCVFRFSYDTTWYVIPVEADEFEDLTTRGDNLYGKRDETGEYTPLEWYLAPHLETHRRITSEESG